jgi:2,3-bisphosphoglycerate-dependent phosphoglycerate mutase
MQLFFVRHGQSTNNALWAHNRSSEGRAQDPELTAIGHRQAQLAAQFLSRNGLLSGDVLTDTKNVNGFGITHLYCSPMVRAVATGTYIAEALNLPLVAWKELHEVGGIFLADPDTKEPVGLPGKPRSYFGEHYPKLVLSPDMHESGWWNRAFEEREERPARGVRVLTELMARHGGTDDRVAFVSHGGFHNYFMYAVINLPLPGQDGSRFIMNNAAITRISFEEDRTWIAYMNRTDFLPEELIT